MLSFSQIASEVPLSIIGLAGNKLTVTENGLDDGDKQPFTSLVLTVKVFVLRTVIPSALVVVVSIPEVLLQIFTSEITLRL